MHTRSFIADLSSRGNEALQRLQARTAPLRAEPQYPGRTLLVWTGLLVAAWYFCAPMIDSGTHMSEADYRRSVLLVPLLERKRMVAFVLLFLFVLVAGWRRLAWSTFVEGRQLRIFVVLVAAALAWGAAFLPYNLFFDQLHMADRLLALLFTALIWRHPGFVPFSLIFNMMLFAELRYPLGDFSWIDKRVVFDSLLLFSLFLPLLLLLGRISCRPYVFVVLSMLAAWYYESGQEKMRLDWYEHDNLTFLMAAATDNGWLPGLGEEGSRRLFA